MGVKSDIQDLKFQVAELEARVAELESSTEAPPDQHAAPTRGFDLPSWVRLPWAGVLR